MHNNKQLLNNVKLIQQKANSKLGDAQQLFAGLLTICSHLSTITHIQATLSVATKSDSLHIISQDTNNTQTHYPCEMIIDRDIDYLPWFISNQSLIAHNISKDDRFFVCIFYSNDKKSLKALSYQNVYFASKRLLLAYTKLHQLSNHKNVLNTSSCNISYLQKLERFVTHGFTREALDNIFSGVKLDTTQHKLHIYNYLGLLAEKHLVKRPFHWADNYSGDICCTISDMLCGNNLLIKALNPDESTKITLTNNIHHLQLCKKHGLKYLIVHLDSRMPFSCKFHKVTKTDALRMIKVLQYNILNTKQSA